VQSWLHDADADATEAQSSRGWEWASLVEGEAGEAGVQVQKIDR